MAKFLRTALFAAGAAVGIATAVRAVNQRMRATVGDPDQAPPLQQVKEVDVQRYLGSWFQIAAVPAWYELQCAKDAKAEYTQRPDGTVGVQNSCITWWGSESRITGAARPLDDTNNQLNVSFRRVGAHEGYRHDHAANYVVIGLGADYDWAVVTDQSRRSGFVLSRTPLLTDDQYDGAKNALQRSGLDTRQLRTTRQTGGAQQRVPFSDYPGLGLSSQRLCPVFGGGAE